MGILFIILITQFTHIHFSYVLFLNKLSLNYSWICILDQYQEAKSFLIRFYPPL